MKRTEPRPMIIGGIIVRLILVLSIPGLIYLPSVLTKARAVSLADNLYGKDSYCWMLPIRTSDRRMTLVGPNELSVRYWRDALGFSSWGDLIGLRRPHFMVIGLEPKTGYEANYGWSYGNGNFYNAYPVDLFVGSGNYEACEAFLESQMQS
ncbi:MAG: hypothetical protein ACPGRD_07335 [Planktomarina sp.]